MSGRMWEHSVPSRIVDLLDTLDQPLTIDDILIELSMRFPDSAPTKQTVHRALHRLREKNLTRSHRNPHHTSAVWEINA